MYKKVFSGLLLVFLAVPAFASAPEFSDIDKDKNGLVSQDEALVAGIPERLFARLDMDKDNNLSVDEYNLLTKGQS